MDFNFSDIQKEINQLVKNAAEKILNKDVFDDDQQERFPREKWNVICGLDILGLPVEPEYGGLGESMLTTAIAIQALGRHCMDEGLIFSLCAHFCTCIIPIWKMGNEKQKEDFLPRLINGKYIGGNGSTEADAGSDLSGMKTTVTKKDETYILNGSKIFVTNGPVADILIIYGAHPGGIKGTNISCFIVESKNPGVKNGQVFHKMGLRTSPLAEIVLDNCVLSSRYLLGRERMGLMIFNQSMYWERVLMAAYHLGAMEQQFDLTLEYANTRKQFGKRIRDYQNISHKLVEMKTNIESAKWFLYNVCWKYDHSQGQLKEASMVKLLISNSKIKNSLHAVQIHGAYGFIKEYQVEKQLRDSMAATIYSGTSEIQKKIISENLEKIDV